MRNRLIFLLLLLSACGGNTDSVNKGTEKFGVKPPAASRQSNIDLEKSFIYWKGTKFNNTRYHEGILKFTAGNLRVENGHIMGGYFLADMKTIKVTDIPEHEVEARTNLEAHLKSDFNVEEFPFSLFQITKMTQNKNRQQICGDLQIRNVLREVCFDTVPEEISYNASLTLKRSEWNIGAEGSWLERRLVDDTFYLTVRIWLK